MSDLPDDATVDTVDLTDKGSLADDDNWKKLWPSFLHLRLSMTFEPILFLAVCFSLAQSTMSLL